MDIFTILGYVSDQTYSKLSKTDVYFALVPAGEPPPAFTFKPIVVMFF